MTQIPAHDLGEGVRMPLVGFGTWRLSDDAAYRGVADALDVGYRHLDTATMYGNEAEIGRALEDSGLPREDVFVTTKLPAESADRPRETLERSLDALRSDHVDLWLIHWPPGGEASPHTWEALLHAEAEGLARAVGVSNYSTVQVDELTSATGRTPAVNQIEWAPPLHDSARLGELRDRDVVVEGYSPFKSSNLDEPVLRDIAEAHDVTAPQVILRWHLQHQIVVIPKTARRERMATNLDVLGFALDAEEMARIDSLGRA